MKIEYAPERGRGFVRHGETEKQQNWGFSGIKKAVPKWSRLSEQITRCAVCVCDPKHKNGNDSRYQAGGQCYQSGSVRCHTCNERFSLYSLRNCSRAKAHGANLSDSCSIFLRRLFRAGDNVLVNSLSVIVLSCIAMRRNTLHHGADGDYSGSLVLRRWSSSRATVTSCPISSAALMPICSTLARASSDDTRGFSPLPSAWRRAISPRMAVTMNPALLSPSSFTDSMPSITSCGIRAVSDCDFAFFEPVAICNPLNESVRQYTHKKSYIKALTCKPPINKVTYTLLMQGAETTKPRTVGAVTGLLTTNDSKIIEAAMRNHTTHPQGRDSHNLNKYIWRFIALSTAQPRVITIEASSEQEARQQSPAGCVMVFAARIRQGVFHA
ncbi:host cell division inhibitor Icd-like protein [Escherichia coli]|nr:host cell division inhibitor Icd-like protein [Escherichia coli]EFL2792127.1 host cell division inhibitor Icd-like protein [Escherichia coli]EFL7267437.1 host cell division inhibitor Icd-like protein [Escherichia coli]